MTQLSTLKRAPKFSMGAKNDKVERRNLQRVASLPGPGAYGNPNNRKTDRFPAGGCAILGTSTREQGFGQMMPKPGPAAYEPDWFRRLSASAV